jgi:hypothetical protein
LRVTSRGLGDVYKRQALEFLSKPVSAGEIGVKNLVWALLASSEFNLNH